MPIQKLSIEAFLDLRKRLPVFDVRSPAEFAHAHIPGAFSVPLFSDEERKMVGTAYKKEGRETAIKIGLDYFGPKMRSMVEKAEELTDGRRQEGLIVHCWRGGMRSGAVSWLLDLYGFRVYTLTGGYKTFRRWAHQIFDTDIDLQIVGGYTGSGKTRSLNALANAGEHVVDLEAIAQHRGSAFGGIGQEAQSTQEMFENRLALGLATPSRIWMEDESQFIGQVSIPPVLWKRMRGAPLHFLKVPFEQRLDSIVDEYGGLDRSSLADAIGRIRKRLGGLEAKQALEHLERNEIRECFSILLRYYDKLYDKGLRNRENWEQLLRYIDGAHMDGPGKARSLMQSVFKPSAIEQKS